MQGIEIDEREVKMWEPEETQAADDSEDYQLKRYNRVKLGEEHLHPDFVKQLNEQATDAEQFHHDGKTPAQRRKEHYATLSRMARFIWWCWMPVVWLSGHINLRAQWMVINAQQVAEFVAAHVAGPVLPWRLRSRRRECRPCEYRKEKFCGASTCNCGEWKPSELKHVTRLSAVACPKGKWGVGWARQAYNWTRNLLARRKEL